MPIMVRPVKPDADRKVNVLRIRLTDEERAALDIAAHGRTSTWARRVLLKVAQSKRHSEESTDTTNAD